MELLGEADDDHEEQQDHQSRGAHGQTHHLELSHHRLAASTLVPDVILDVTSRKRQKRENRGWRERAGEKKIKDERGKVLKYGDRGVEENE